MRQRNGVKPPSNNAGIAVKCRQNPRQVRQNPQSADLKFPQKGYYEVWARATDDRGVSQPFAIAWNPKGYLNNSMHRISVRVS